METRQASKRPVDIDYDVEDEDQYYVTPRPHTSARRYNLPPKRDTLDDPVTQTGEVIQRRRSAVAPVTGSGVTSKAISPTITKSTRRIRRLPLLAVIVGMVVMALLAVTFSALGSWWQLHQDDSTYGRPRTYQTDAVVGHNDSDANPSHFIFINLNRHVVIIELPGGDTTHARIYNGPTLFGNGQDLTPVTGEFRDVNGDGKLDMIVHIQDQRLVYINDGTQFRPLQPGEQVNM
ncbi:MAG: hypothetical protein E6I93_01130 [Chloroflexi bacterium]|nr:MAG: hypothetical protein E6I93_01130 [Chloroflexota bacterium]